MQRSTQLQRQRRFFDHFYIRFYCRLVCGIFEHDPVGLQSTHVSAMYIGHHESWWCISLLYAIVNNGGHIIIIASFIRITIKSWLVIVYVLCQRKPDPYILNRQMYYFLFFPFWFVKHLQHGFEIRYTNDHGRDCSSLLLRRALQLNMFDGVSHLRTGEERGTFNDRRTTVDRWTIENKLRKYWN